MSTLIRNKPFIPASEFPSWQQQGVETRRTYDAFQNALARLGFGTNNLLEGTSYPLTRLSRNYLLLQSLYRNNWIVRKVVDSMADDMLKNWLKVVTELPPDQISRFNKVIDDTATVEKLRESMHWGRLYGGAAAVIIIKGHGKKLDKPLNLDDVQPNSYLGLLPFDRWAGITPAAEINSDIDRPTDFGLPKAYKITVEGGGSYDVHSSRVLRFIGRKLPNWERQAEIYWGESEVEVFYEELKKRDNTSWNLATLIFRANILSIRQKDLSQQLSGVGSNQQALARFTATMRAMNDMMSNQGMLILPEEGGMEQHTYSFAGIAEVYEQFKQDICGATEYPYSRLFGRPSGGMGTTNEGDEHTYYDNVSAKQRSELDPQLKKLLPVVAMSTWGEVPEDFSWTFNPVRSLSNEEQAEMGAKKTTSIIEAYNANVITQKIAMQELKQQADESNLFSNITDDDIEKADDDFLDPMAMGEMGGEGGLPEMGPEGDDEEGGDDDEPEPKGEEEKNAKKDKKKKDKKSEKKPKRGPNKNGSGEAPKTSKPKGGKDSSILARIKRAYQFGGELATIGKRHNDGSYTLDVNGKEFIADRESFDFISDSADLKLFKSNVQFQSPGTGKDHCCDCVHFDLKNASCQVVEGNVRPKDWCTEFEFGLSHVSEQLADEAGKFSKKFEKLKTFPELKPSTQAKIRGDKRQKSLLGPGHERELQEKYKKKPKAEDSVSYQVVEEDGYVKVKHSDYGTVAAGTLGSDGRVHNIEFIKPEYQKSNQIRQPAMAALQKFEKKKKAKDEDTDTERQLSFQSLTIMIENEVGSVRYHQNGKTTITHPYGYILGTRGVDGDRIDVFVGPDENAPNVYVVHSNDPNTGNFDEDKCMLGFASAALAKDAFIDNYGGDESFFDSMDKFSFPEFVAKLREQGKKITVNDAWEEQAHPRAGAGQEVGNSHGGQFVAKGSGGGAAKEKAPSLTTFEKNRVDHIIARFKHRVQAGGRKPEDVEKWIDLHYPYEKQDIRKEAVAQYVGGFKKESPDKEREGAQAIAKFENWAQEHGFEVGQLGKEAEKKLLDQYLKEYDAPEEVKQEARNQWSKRNPEKKELGAAEIKKLLAKPEIKQQILEFYQKNRRMGSIASAIGLARDKAGRAVLRRVLRKAGVYKENGGWVKATIKPGHLDAGFGAEMIKKIEQIENHLKSTDISSTSRLGGGVNVTRVVHFADGSKGVFKPHRGEAPGMRRGFITDGYQTEREVAAWEIAKLVGMHDLVTPVIDRTYQGERGALLEFEPGKVAMSVKNGRYDGHDDSRRMAVFDFVIGNTDRHEGNWLVSESKIHLIDHGLAFPEKNGIQRNAALRKITLDLAHGREVDDTPQKYAQAFIQNKQKLGDLLRGLGLPEEAAGSLQVRIDQLARAKKWEDLASNDR